ncbi:hypothetical protein ES705_18306 [subsurface metagenome]
MVKDLLKTNNWYGKLIIDLKRLAFEGIVKTKHAIGKRILEDELKLGKPEYGSKKVENLADDLDVSRSDLYFCIQFAKKYPELSNALENLSWREIVKLLPEHIEERGLTIKSIYEAKLYKNKLERKEIICENKGWPEDLKSDLIKDHSAYIKALTKRCREVSIELIKMERNIGFWLNWFKENSPEVYNFIEAGPDIIRNLGIVIKECNAQIKKLEKKAVILC